MTLLKNDSAPSDVAWFDANPSRHYRVRKSRADAWVIIRKRSDHFLRAIARSLSPRFRDDDDWLRGWWVATAWGSLSQADQDRLVREIKASETSSKRAPK